MPNRSPFRRAFEGTREFWNTALQRHSRLTGSIYWAVNDKDKFCMFIEELQTLIEDLERFTDNAGSLGQQRLIIEYEMAIIDDEASLEAIAEVSPASHGDDTVSSAARRRLNQVEERSVITNIIQPDDSASMLSKRFTGALRPISASSGGRTVFANGDDEAITDQVIDVLWIEEDNWRFVKTEQGVLPYLPTLLAARSSSVYGSLSGDGESTDAEAGGNTTDVVDEHERRLATRLAINSKILLGEVRRITGLSLTARQNVLVYPFKALIVYERKIRNALANAAEVSAASESTVQFAHVENPGLDEAPSPCGTESVSEALKLKLRLRDELACLVAFMDTEVLPSAPTVDALESSNITFNQLWQLFWDTDLIFDRRSDQAYVLLQLQGGRRVLDVENHSKSRHNETAETTVHSVHGETQIITDFVIWSARLDCDGSRVGPVLQKFTIEYFAGQRALQSLPCAPLKYRAAQDRLVLELRGCFYLESMKMGHFSYTGPPLDDLAHEHMIDCLRCQQQPRRADLVNKCFKGFKADEYNLANC